MTDERLNVDGVPHDGVGHDVASHKDLARFKDASDTLARFRAPLLLGSSDPHGRLFFVAFDGTGNNKFNDPEHATNVAKIFDQLEELNLSGHRQIYPIYIEGPGTQEDWLTSKRDSAFGVSYEENISRAYDEVVAKTNEWMRKDPETVVRVQSIGFSRGASQVPGFARLLHENGIPDLDSEARATDGAITYGRYLVEPGKTVQAVGLFDPVATGAPMKFDRRLPPSVVSGFQITSADEKRATFPTDRILPRGLSEDGRFLNVMVPGAHSDVGGGYLRDGLSIRCGNLMRDYCNALRDEPYLQKEFEPTDQRLNVIHRSTEGEYIFRVDPRASVRGEPSGTNESLAPRHIEHAGPAPHRPEPVDPRLDGGLVRRHVPTGPANMVPDRLPYPPSSPDAVFAAGRSVPFAPKVLGAVGAVATAVDIAHTLDRTAALQADANVAGGASEVLHFASRNAAGWTGAETFMAAGAAVGVESGPGMFVTGAVGGLVGYVAGDKVADAIDRYLVNHQEDPQGNTWRLDIQQGWTRDIPPLPDKPHGQTLVADAALSSRLSYQASNTAVELALAGERPPHDPFTQPAAPGDSHSLKDAPWTRQVESHQWTRQVTDERLEHGLTRSHVETAGPQRATELDQLAERTVQQNVAESPLGIAQRYRLAYEQQGWDKQGPMPPAVVHALNAPTDRMLASDGHTYSRSGEHEWSRPGTFFGTNPADARMREELNLSERTAREARSDASHLDAMSQSVAPAIPSRLDDPRHPDHAFFNQVRDHLVELDKSLGRSPDHYTDNIASALTVQARADGIERIDRINLSSDGNTLHGVKIPEGPIGIFLAYWRTQVPTSEANTPMEQSGARWPEAMQQFQSQEQAEALATQQRQEQSQARSQAQAMDGPSLGR